jgi:hypothetical protein
MSRVGSGGEQDQGVFESSFDAGAHRLDIVGIDRG